MGDDGNWLDKISEFVPATRKALEVIDHVTGMALGPGAVRRMGKAEADRIRILAQARADAMEIETRARIRAESEQVRHQVNMEAVALCSLPHLKEDAKPEDVEEDWISKFFQYARDVSNAEMREVWARILAGEFNKARSFSTRTLSTVSMIDVPEAKFFNTVCSFGVRGNGNSVAPIIWRYDHKLYKDHGITYFALSNLEDLGLIRFDSSSPFWWEHLPKTTGTVYEGKYLSLTFKDGEMNRLLLGNVILSTPGSQLATICETKPIEGFVEHVVNLWKQNGVDVQVFDQEP